MISRSARRRRMLARLTADAGLFALLGALLPTLISPAAAVFAAPSSTLTSIAVTRASLPSPTPVTPPDVTTPVLSPNPAVPGDTVTVTATATVTTASGVASAELSLDGGAWVAMSATDGAFGDPSEGLNGTITAPGSTPTHTICVRATDSAASTSDGTACTTLTVTVPAADIAINKTVDNPAPNQNANATFTITAGNNGPSNATGVRVTDLLPAGLTFVSAVPSVGTYTSGTGVWNIGALANGTNATLSIVATVTGTTTVTNTATKTAEVEFDPVASNDSASATVTGQAADIAINKTVDNPTPNQNTNVTFTITANNNGPSNGTGVQVTDLLPAGLIFVSAVPSAGTYNPVTGVWNIGALANGSSATLSVVATVNATAATTNTATKTAENQPDPVAGNDSASATVTVPQADIAINKTVDNPAPNQNANVTFTITAGNNGPSNATGVQVTDLLPAGLTFVSATSSAGTTYLAGTGVWNIGALASGANATLSIVATVTGTTPVTNTASKTAEVQFDPVAGNDSASATVIGQSATKLNQMITFANPGPTTMIQSPLTVSATASSGLTVTLTSTTLPVCTVSAMTITLVGPGTCTIVASQLGDATYNQAPSVSRSFMVKKLNQTITFANPGPKTMVQSPFTVSATASSGLTVALTSTTLPVCTVSALTITLVGPGTCTIVASQAGDANYNPAPSVSRSFLVKKLNQTITFANPGPKTMIQSPLTVSATASSALIVTLTSTTLPVCTVSVLTITLVGPGTCTIVASQAGDATYNPAPSVSRSFLVKKLNQTITFANPGPKTMIQSPFTVSATASSGLTVTLTSTTPAVCTVSALTITLVGPGSCTIVAAQAGDANYNPAPSVSRSFTVT